MYAVLLFGLISIPVAQEQLHEAQYALQSEAERLIYHEEISKALLYAPSDDLETLRRQAENYTRMLYQRARDLYDLPKIPLESIVFDRLIGPAARTDVKNRVVLLNEVMFLRHHELFIEVIIPHEVAHIIAYQRINEGDTYHTSRAWRDAMTLLVGYWQDHHHLPVHPSLRLYRRLKLAKPDPCESCTVSLTTPYDDFDDDEPPRHTGSECHNIWTTVPSAY